MSSPTRPVTLLFSPPLVHLASLLPSNPRRAHLVFSLLHAFGFLRDRPEEAYVVRKGEVAGRRELEAYHEREYVERLLKPVQVGEEGDGEERAEEFGLSDDCPAFPHLPAYALHIAGASLSAASFVLSPPSSSSSSTTDPHPAPIAINWTGGRHHAQRARAAGFCYVQDCVLVIQRLRSLPPSPPTRARPRIMYLDLDLHFSDAVSTAFLHSPSVLTLSIHHASPGFYPSTSLSALTTADTPTPTSISLPLSLGASPRSYAHIWPSIDRLRTAFHPDYVVLQAGLDALAGDPCRTFNLCLDRNVDGSMGWMVERVREWGVGMVVLGGGGYKGVSAARGWVYLTSILAGRPLDVHAEIPEHANWAEYGPSFTLDVPAGNMRDENTEEYLDEVGERLGVLAGRIEVSRSRGTK